MTKDWVGMPNGFDRAAGQLQLAAERRRVDAALSRATPPSEMVAAPVAPASEPKRLVREFVAVGGGMRRLVSQHWERADVFDAMTRAALRRHGDAPGFAAPFTPGQIYMARHYRDLTEKHGAGGVKCSSLEAGRAGGQGGDFMDAFLADGRELAALHRKIGSGQAMVLRRVRPSVRGSKASILDRKLVDAVCIGGLTLGAVLRAHGWSVKGEHRDALRSALCGALDRMQGYR